jgi:murein L,D-transpeptidase YafK
MFKISNTSLKASMFAHRKFAPMMRIFLIALFCIHSLATQGQSTLLSQQLQFPRVQKAIENYGSILENELNALGLDTGRSFDIYFRAFKEEEELEVWIKEPHENQYRKFTTWIFCSSVGFLGPKRQQGDRQIPEGFYNISMLNPQSDYHLSMKINYPNASDRILGHPQRPGGQIFMHGGCETIGCIPMTDSIIEKAYVLVLLSNGNRSELGDIPFHIFPNRMEIDNYKRIVSNYNDLKLSQFWGNLRTCYVYFERYKCIPHISINANGLYLFRPCKME